jgi:chitosanase
MKLTATQRLICDRVINVFETGTVKGNYGAISIYNDGPHDIYQITYGRSQTTEYGNLGKLVDMYSKAGGLYSDELQPYVKLIGNVALVQNEPFKTLLRKAGNDDPVMWATQDKFFDLVYFEPARKWAETNGFTLGLSMLVIYDSFIHSGGILGFLRSRFSELTPKKGGDEKVWIGQYVDVRNKWLSTHSKPVIKASAYRTRDLLREIKRSNWDLALLPILANGTPVSDQPAAAKPAVPAIPKAEPDALVPFLGEVDEADLVVGHVDVAEAVADMPDAPATKVLAATIDKPSILRQLAASVNVSPAMERLISYRDKHHPNSDPRYWAIVNFDLHSSKPRLFLFDCVVGQVSQHLCAHGKGSDPDHNGVADLFSNKDGSNCTSLGIYHCDVTYTGAHGKSLYLDGLEATNSAARARHIVMHGADYVSQEWVNDQGKIGRSLGCPAIPMGQVEKIIPKLMGGSLLIHWKSKT